MRPDDSSGDPVLEADRHPLRTRPVRRAGPHGCQEDRQDPRRWRLACARGDRCQPPKPPQQGTDPLRLRPLAGRRPLPVGVQRDPARREGHHLRRVLARAINYFADHGITQVERLMTDNALAYRNSLREVCAAHGVRQKFIRPHCPWQNGKSERLNRTLATEWAYRQAFTTNTQRAAALAPWLEHYNTQRRHSALGGLPPISRLSPT